MKLWNRHIGTAFIATFMMCCLPAWGASIDLADKPLSSGVSSEVKPNVMLILDDSGSMGWTHLPDHVRGQTTKYGYKSAQCNGVYYNPTITYSPPVKSDGSNYPNADFYNASYNGFDTASDKVNLSSQFKAYNNTTSWGKGDDTPQAAYYYKYAGLQPALSYTYLSSGSVDTSATFYQECNSTIGSSPGNGVFTKVTVSSAEQQNFANWYSYYRIRIYTAKSAVGKALSNVGEPGSYRFGFTTHSYTGTDSTNSEFLKINDFCTAATGCTQRTDFFSKLYSAGASGGTPLRAALSKVGRIYAGKLLTGADDPMQYSCQQNFTILTTDGFWNGDEGYRIDGTTAIGNQDGTAPKPLWDGASGSKNVDVYRRYDYSTSGCKSGKYKQKEQTQTVTTPIDPPGVSTTSAWVDITSWSKCATGTFPSPDPSNPELIYSEVQAASGGTSNSLADVSMYYYETDLRDSTLGNCTGAKGLDVCEDNVPGAGNDLAKHQHMTTFTLGLGIDGSLKYAENYDAGGSADFNAIKQGTKNWPNPMDNEDLHRVDDLWHAAVDGRGKYFSAKSPESLASGIAKALAGVSAVTASAAAAATSNLEPVAGDNFAYVAKYTTVDWEGDIEAREINLTDGTVSDTANWSAREKLDTLVGTNSDTRAIYFSKSGSLADFKTSNLSTQIALKYFDAGIANPNGALSQYGAYTAADITAATPDSIINFLRGQTQHEDEDGNTNRLYRDRKHALGDIIHGAPVYARKPPFNYSDSGYASFKDNNAGRQGVVYAAANDGMLHAFNGDTGAELWAFVPTQVIPYLYKLADKGYSTHHRYYVDGPITIGDVCLSSSCSASQWKTILVGGLGKGGRAYFALDVTNPANPQLLWEFADANLGYTYGNPIITKRQSDGKWVVIVASGYNNADGKGRLYVLDAKDGSKLSEIYTSTSVTDPAVSGIAKINNWVESTLLDNVTQHVYGGDLDGNVWRFDIVAGSSTKLATIGKVGGAPTQPITTKPELAKLPSGGTDRIVMVGTGKYLGEADIATTDMMSIYAIRDDLSSVLGNFRVHPNVVVQDLSAARTISYTAPGTSSFGWYMDLDAKMGERVDVDPKLQLGWLAVVGNKPDPNACNIGGSSWLYFLEYWPSKSRTSNSNEVITVGNALTVGINTIKLPNGKVVTITTTSDAKYKGYGNPPQTSASKVRRLYWRELVR